MPRSAVPLLLLLVLGCSQPPPEAPAPEQYDYYCSRCHGTDGRGTPEQLELHPKNDLGISEMVRTADRDKIRQRITEGYGPMPALEGKVEPIVIDKITTYTLELLPSH